ncbi:MAG: hypothetical protein K8T25_14450, partial [Planctomycetia bacterium]|nr:hypothetical protein [Planctomycetia bacterium]
GRCGGPRDRVLRCKRIKKRPRSPFCIASSRRAHRAAPISETSYIAEQADAAFIVDAKARKRMQKNAKNRHGNAKQCAEKANDLQRFARVRVAGPIVDLIGVDLVGADLISSVGACTHENQRLAGASTHATALAHAKCCCTSG